MGTAARRPHRIVSIPSSDATFAQVIEAIIRVGHGATEADLEAALRPIYPQVVVRGRELSGERFTTWYVYRDRTYARRRDRAWWLGSSVVSMRIRLDGRIAAADPGAASLLGRSVEDLIGRSYLEFVEPAGRAIASAIWESLLHGGVAETVLSVPRPDGSTVVVEGRAVLDDDGIAVFAREAGADGAESPPGER